MGVAGSRGQGRMSVAIAIALTLNGLAGAPVPTDVTSNTTSTVIGTTMAF